MVGPYFFIVNPRAGNGRAAKLWPALVSLLDGANVEYRAAMVSSTNSAMSLAERVPEGWTAVAVGGDGVMAQVAAGLAPGSNVGLIPVGRTADFARTVGYSASPPKALLELLDGETRPLDLPCVNGQPFLNAAGVGLDARLAACSHDLSALGAARRLGHVAQHVARGRSPLLRVELDGRQGEGKLFHLAIGNGRYAGGGMRLFPTAHFDDGLLDVTITGDLRLHEAFAALFHLARGSHVKRRKVHYAKAHTVKVDGPEDVVVHADGNIVGRLPAVFSLRPRSLQLVVPKGSWNPSKVTFIHHRRLPEGGAHSSP